MSFESVTEAASAGVGSAVAVSVALGQWHRRREIRRVAEFRRAVQDIVNESVADVIARQTESERRQGQHLDRQDKAIEALRAEVRSSKRVTRAAR